MHHLPEHTNQDITRRQNILDQMLDPDLATECLLYWYIPCKKNSEDIVSLNFSKFIIKTESSIISSSI